MVLTTTHDRLKHCNDRRIPAKLRRCSQRFQDGENVLKNAANDLFCICKKPDDGSLMIQCDTCDNWYHGIVLELQKMWQTP